MIAVFPIFLTPQEQFWCQPQFSPLIARTFRVARKTPELTQVYVFSNESVILSLARAAQLTAVRIDADDASPVPELFSRGTMASIDHLKRHHPQNADVLMILGFRNPFLSVTALSAACRKFNRSGCRILFSGVKSVDHPAQLQAHYTIADTGFVHVFDARPKVAGYLCRMRKALGEDFIDNMMGMRTLRVTKPFHFKWAENLVPQVSRLGIYYRECRGFHLVYLPIEKKIGAGASAVDLPLFYDLGNDTAAVLFNEDDLGPPSSAGGFMARGGEVLGAAICPHPGCPLLVRGADQRNYFMGLDRGESGGGLLKNDVFAFQGMTAVGSVAGPSERITLRDSSGPICLPDSVAAGHAIVYALLRSVTDHGTCDISEPYACNIDLWHEETNLMTGRKMTGRQDFPDVFEPDGSFCILHKDESESLAAQLVHGHAACHVLAPADSLRIETQRDLLRYRAALRAKQ